MQNDRRDGLRQAREELLRGAAMLQVEIDAYEGTLPALYEQCAMMCESIIEYFRAEAAVEAAEAGR